MKKYFTAGLGLAGVLALGYWLLHSGSQIQTLPAPGSAIPKSSDQQSFKLPVSNPETPAAAQIVSNIPAGVSLGLKTNGIAVDANTNAPTAADEAMAAKTRLAELGFSTNPAAMTEIISYFTNSDAEVRSLAVETVKQAGNHDTVPLLEKIAAETEDPLLKGQLTQAALFLTIPTINDRMPLQTEYNGLPPKKPGSAPGSAPSGPTAHDSQSRE